MLDLPANLQETAVSLAHDALVSESSAAAPKRPPRAVGLAGRLLLLTVGFVFLALGSFFVYRLAAFRETWLNDRLAAAHRAVAAFDATGQADLPTELSQKILASVGVSAIEIVTADRHRVLANPGHYRFFVSTGPAPPPYETYEPGDASLAAGVTAAFHTLLAPEGALMRIVEPPRSVGFALNVTVDEAPLVEDMWRVSRNFLTIALLVAGVVTCVLWIALWRMVLRPVSRLTTSIIAFGERPQDVSQIIAPSGRSDEIGHAELALAETQRSLAHELGQRKRLAELGMAVARINHDLRNILAAAQLISDRLASIPDPLAQRLAPRLVATLDRAIEFCQSTLTYGGAREQTPARRRFDLSELVRQVVEAAEAERGSSVAYAVDIPPRFELYADPDHVLRTLENLNRNACQALQAKGPQEGRPAAIRFAAIRADGVALIEISDTGPGFPPNQVERIFEPFHKSTHDGGAGLGLAIAADLVERNGGSIVLAPSKSEDFYCGARFLIRLPTPEKSARRLPRVQTGP